MELYKEILLEHYRNPRNAGKINNPDFSSGADNLLCGDSIVIEGKIDNNILTDVRFTGQGCVLSQAAASMITEACKGKTIDELLILNKDFVLDLIEIPLGPNRLKCALLSLEALQKGIKTYKEKSR